MKITVTDLEFEMQRETLPNDPTQMKKRTRYMTARGWLLASTYTDPATGQCTLTFKRAIVPGIVVSGSDRADGSDGKADEGNAWKNMIFVGPMPAPRVVRDLSAEYEAYRQAAWDKNHAVMSYDLWLMTKLIAAEDQIDDALATLAHVFGGLETDTLNVRLDRAMAKVQEMEKELLHLREHTAPIISAPADPLAGLTLVEYRAWERDHFEWIPVELVKLGDKRVKIRLYSSDYDREIERYVERKNVRPPLETDTVIIPPEAGEPFAAEEDQADQHAAAEGNDHQHGDKGDDAIAVNCPECDHEFTVPGAGRYPCPSCGAEYFMDDYRETIIRHGCMVCGVHEPGNEDWDWCDHETGEGCMWNDEALDDDDFDYEWDEAPRGDEGVETLREYVYLDGTSAGMLTAEQAEQEGFCPGCGAFVLGSDDDRTLRVHGLCVECVEELRVELGEYDDDSENGGY